MKRALRSLKIAIGISLLVWLLASVDLGEVVRVARQGDPGLLALGLAMMLLSLPVFQAWRLHVLIDAYTASWATTLHVFFVGAFFNNLLPSNVGGDAVRLVYLQRMRGGNWGAPLALLMLHRLSGIGVILVAALVYLLLAGDEVIRALSGVSVAGPSLWIVLSTIGAVALAAIAVRLMPAALRDKLLGRFTKLWTDFVTGLREVGGPAMTWLIVLTAGYHVTRLLGFLYVVRYMGQDVGFGELIIVMAVTAVLAIVPITVGALGVMEGSITLMLGAYGVSEPAAVTVALANRLVLLLSALVGGVLYVTERAGSKPAAGTLDRELPDQ